MLAESSDSIGSTVSDAIGSTVSEAIGSIVWDDSAEVEEVCSGAGSEVLAVQPVRRVSSKTGRKNLIARKTSARENNSLCLTNFGFAIAAASQN